MTAPTRIAAALAIAAWSLLAPDIVAADESGGFSMLRISIVDYTTIDHGDGSAFARVRRNPVTPQVGGRRER